MPDFAAQAHQKESPPFTTTAAAHPGLGKASDSGSEMMATQSIFTKNKSYRVPQDVRCITTPILARETLRSPVASLWSLEKHLQNDMKVRYNERTKKALGLRRNTIFCWCSSAVESE